MKITFADAAVPKSGTLVVFSLADNMLLPSARAVDETTGGSMSRALKAGRFKGKAEDSLSFLSPAGTELDRVVLAGLGKASELTQSALERIGGRIARQLDKAGVKDAVFLVDPVEDVEIGVDAMAAALAHGARLAVYRFDKYRTEQKDEQKPALKQLSVRSSAGKKAKKLFDRFDHVAEGVNFARDLVWEPGNELHPIAFAQRCKALEKVGVKVEILGEKQLRKQGFGALLAVSEGSAREAQVVIMRYDGAGDDQKPVALVGKGVTFDTGGISLKPAAGMGDMKFDMAGAAAVAGAMRAIAGRKAKANVVGIIGLVENMPSDRAMRPGDVITSLAGKTIEVLNTDAEGRLVLADILWHVQKTHKPQVVVDLATLTGAVIATFGHEFAGVFANDDTVSDRLSAAGRDVGERLWRLPLDPVYDKTLDSDIADMKNIGGDRNAGSIVAAQFLQRFVEAETPWAHIDIAGMAWAKKDSAIVPKGGSGFGVRLLDRFVADAYEG